MLVVEQTHLDATGPLDESHRSIELLGRRRGVELDAVNASIPQLAQQHRQDGASEAAALPLRAR